MLTLDTLNIHFFKKFLLIFWALWWLIAFWTDIVGGLAHLNLLHASWAPDANYPGLKQSLSMYPLYSWIPPALFICIIAGSLLSSVLFFRARITYSMQRVDTAFIFSLIFWLVFFLADQCIMKFDLEENHMVQGGFELLSYLAIRLLPD